MWNGRPDSDGPPSNTITPTKPMTSASHSRGLGRSPDSTDSTAIHSGIVAHTTAAPLDATLCSPTAMKPLPPSSSAAA